MAVVELKSLSKHYGSFVALAQLDLKVEDGSFLVLLGPSGCGKSTTMRLIAGLDEPSGGDIVIDGQRVNDVPPRDRNLAMVFQNYALYPHMSVEENICYPLKVKKVPLAQRRDKVQKVAELVELGDLLHRRPAELSGGQRQRVALARAIIKRPQLFLMDEPLSNLDARLRTVMRAELKHLQRELAITTIYVTHDQVEAMTLADEVVVLNEGHIQQIGTPAQIYASPANTFVASFIGSPPMNLLPGEIVDGKFRHSSGEFAVATAPHREVTLGIRPEDIRLGSVADADLVGAVYSAELLGDAALVNVRLGELRVTAKVTPEENPADNTTVGLNFRRDKILLFAADGKLIGAAQQMKDQRDD